MATWGDYISLTVVLSIIAALVYGVIYINQSFRKAVVSTKQNLQARGIEISKQGASVKTKTKLVNREEYFDATQRKVVKALANSSVGHDSLGSVTSSKSSQSPKLR
ncbi:hypothetical protein BDY19DRAFT_1048443 [Irpex rosettiformis]|uniref:Uncharacterized protein n=1 Tax=Irpex rosettiformis TaxID=378272 RepID=A0ACB8U465_9APHY|nr:hypothetical protein BDY19DRAFT_1048443 [Irpex rosettiformis]